MNISILSPCNEDCFHLRHSSDFIWDAKTCKGFFNLRHCYLSTKALFSYSSILYGVCYLTFIVYFIHRNAVQIVMANFSKFDRIESIVTKPEGDFTCDEKTDLRRFMWVMTHDVSVFMTFLLCYSPVKWCEVTVFCWCQSCVTAGNLCHSYSIFSIYGMLMLILLPACGATITLVSTVTSYWLDYWGLNSFRG